MPPLARIISTVSSIPTRKRNRRRRRKEKWIFFNKSNITKIFLWFWWSDWDLFFSLLALLNRRLLVWEKSRIKIKSHTLTFKHTATTTMTWTHMSSATSSLGPCAILICRQIILNIFYTKLLIRCWLNTCNVIYDTMSRKQAIATQREWLSNSMLFTMKWTNEDQIKGLFFDLWFVFTYSNLMEIMARGLTATDSVEELKTYTHTPKC